MTSPCIGWTGPPSFTHFGSPAHPATFWRGCVQVARVALSHATVTARTCCSSAHLERGCLAVERVYVSPCGGPVLRGQSQTREHSHSTQRVVIVSVIEQMLGCLLHLST